MVAFGDYLDRIEKEHAAQTLGIDYCMLKRVLEESKCGHHNGGLGSVGGSSSRQAHTTCTTATASISKCSSLASVKHSGRAPSVDTLECAESGGSLSDSGRLTPTLPPSPQSSSAYSHSRRGFAGGAGGSAGSPLLAASSLGQQQRNPRRFVSVLEGEIARFHRLVKEKLRLLHRAGKAVQLSRAVRTATHRDVQEQNIVTLQLANVYEEVVMMLLLMRINAIAVSKIVKKYNKHFPDNFYIPDPDRIVFLKTGPAHAQKAKITIEAEFAALAQVDIADSERLLLSRNATVARMSELLCEVQAEQAKHLCPSELDDAAALLAEARRVANLPVSRPAKRPHRQPAAAAAAEIPSLPSFARFFSEKTELDRRFDILCRAGSGAYGVVHKARRRSNGEVVAVKTVKNPWCHPVLGQRMYREIQIMQQLAHPNVLPLDDVLAGEDDSVHLVMPFVSHTCDALLEKRQLLMPHKKWFLLQLLSALAYIHSRGVVHRDIKLSNILVDDTPRLLLSDFGLARTIGQGAAATLKDSPDYVQTQWYRAPEVMLMRSKTYTGSDMWSTGCVLGEMLTGVPVFPGQDDQHQLQLILATSPPPPPSQDAGASLGDDGGACGSPSLAPEQCLAPTRTLSEVIEACWRTGQQQDFEREPALDLLEKLLRFDPEARISARDAMEHAWFDDDSFPKGSVAEVKRNADVMWEGLVELDLSCTRLHKLKQYKGAVQSHGQNIPLLRKKMTVQGDLHEAASIIQRAWRWKQQGGARPDLEAIARSRQSRKLKYTGLAKARKPAGASRGVHSTAAGRNNNNSGGSGSGGGGAGAGGVAATRSTTRSSRSSTSRGGRRGGALFREKGGGGQWEAACAPDMCSLM